MAKTEKEKTINATGRRKTSSARVRLSVVEGGESEEISDQKVLDERIVINGRAFSDYFPRETSRMLVMHPLELTERVAKYQFKINVHGGGVSGQAGAVRHGISRALEKAEEELRSPLKKEGLLTRDPRAVERKKPGRHKARKGTQFSKR